MIMICTEGKETKEWKRRNFDELTGEMKRYIAIFLGLEIEVEALDLKTGFR